MTAKSAFIYFSGQCNPFNLLIQYWLKQDKIYQTIHIFEKEMNNIDIFLFVLTTLTNKEQRVNPKIKKFGLFKDF